jgi:hypothetical protein
MPTDPVMIPRIREICLAEGRKPEQYNYNQTMASRLSYTVDWWRKGVKERIEKSNRASKPGSEGSNVVAFDGQVVRAVSEKDKGTSAAIDTIEATAWNGINRVHPYSMLFEYYNVPNGTVNRSEYF